MTWSYAIARAAYPSPLCAYAGRDEMKCNPEGGTYEATATREGSQPQTVKLCARHASALAWSEGLPFPTVAA